MEGWDLGIFLRVRESTLQVTTSPANAEHTMLMPCQGCACSDGICLAAGHLEK